MATLPESMMLNETQRLELERIKAQALLARKNTKKRCIRCGGVMGKHPNEQKAKEGIRQCPYCFMNYSPNALPYELSWTFEEEFRKKIK